MRTAALITIAFMAIAQPLGAAEGWTIFLDASAVFDIKVEGDSIWCASNGGVLMYDAGADEFSRWYEGLRSSELNAVAVDGEGNVWAAMKGSGIARIDDPGGEARTSQYSATIDFILSDSVSCLLAVEDDIYYGSTAGVAKFFEGFHAFEPRLTDSTSGLRINDLAWDESGNMLWIAWNGGISSFDRETLSYVAYRIGKVNSVCIHEGEAFCATATGIRNFAGGAWPAYGADLPAEPLAVRSGGGEICCITSELVYRWNGVYWQFQEAAQMKDLFLDRYRIGWSQKILRALAVGGDGVSWTGGEYVEGKRGAYLNSLSGGQWVNHSPSTLSQNEIVAIDVDPAGNAWFSTSRFGISYRSAGGEWAAYWRIRTDTGDDEALSYFINNLALLYDSRGYLWCNALDFDLDRLDVGDPLDKEDDAWEHFALGEGTITSNRFVGAVEDREGNRWFLSDDARFEEGIWGMNIASADGGDWLQVDPSTHPQMVTGNVFGCVFDQSGAYLALRGSGVKYWHTGGFEWGELVSTAEDYWTTILSEDQLTSTELRAIERGPDGSIWLGTSAGLVRYDSGRIDSFTVKTGFDGEGLVGGTVHDLEFDAFGALWVATNRGLNRIGPDGSITDAYTTALLWQDELQFIYPADVVSPLPDARCTDLAYDPAGDFLWIGTSGGLARLDATPSGEEEIPLSEAVLYPNPVHAGRGDTDLRISRIRTPVDIRVYTVEGELVHEAFGVEEGGVAWDMLTLNGFEARSGIYIVTITSEEGSDRRKVAVIK